MAAKSFFLGGVDLSNLTLARVDGRESIGAYPQLIEEVHARCGADVASLFAEPIKGANRATGEPNVAWYCDIEGTPFLLSQLDPRARQSVVELLQQRLRSFSSAIGDPRSGSILASWLYVLSADSILAVSGQPVIKNWGMLPADVAASEEARETHFRNTIGRYIPSLPTPPFSELEGQSFAGRMSQVAEREIAKAAPPPEPVAPVPPPPAPAEPVVAAPAPILPPPPVLRAVPAWRAPAIAAGVAAVVLAILLFGGILRYPAFSEGSDAEAIAAQRATNEQLQKQLDRLRQAGDKVCEAPRRTGSADPLLPPVPTRTQVAANEPGKTQPEVRSLATLLSKATVLVLAGDSLGSGFFISDRHIVTNHHVVGDTVDVKVGNKTIGGLVEGKVVATGSGAGKGTQDIAVIEVAPQANVAFLKIAVTPDQLTQVTAAGFPGAVIDTIQRSGHELPEPNFTQGIVTSRQQQQPDGIETIIHTAQIGHGNSGGPLVDAGGCVVGMNSWANFDQEDNVIFSSYFQAFDASEIAKFLTAKGIGFTASGAPCAPLAATPIASAQPAPAPASARPAQ